MAAIPVLSGYLHPDYALGLGEFGEPLPLPRSGGWLLKRRIKDSDLCDAIGPYPYLVCQDWSGLEEDLKALDNEVVSVAAAPDPFGRFHEADLRRCFPDRLIPFKTHYVADLSHPFESIVSPHHQKHAQAASAVCVVEISDQPMQYLREWVSLFRATAERFGITGIRGFSEAAFTRHLGLPGAVMSLARVGGEAVAAHVMMLHDDVVYTHLAASHAEARNTGADYALYAAEIRYHAGRSRWIDWGGAPGLAGGGGGLAKFKQGWSTGTRQAWFGGRVSQPGKYAALTHRSGPSAGDYFPSYRSPSQF